MQIEYNDPEKVKRTGVVASVFPFDNAREFSIQIRSGGFVDVYGSAVFTPQQAHLFAEGIHVAATVAEGGCPMCIEKNFSSCNRQSIQVRDVRNDN